MTTGEQFMERNLSDSFFYRANGVFYPRGYVFAMFDHLSRARAVVTALRALDGMGENIDVVDSAVILEALTERASRPASAMPWLGRGRRCMQRYVELAEGGMCGVLAQVDQADKDAVAAFLRMRHAQVASYYRMLGIAELTERAQRTRASAARQL
jgi:hypothetical protein